ncbi:MAG: DUF4875 domain-containing protein [Desulfovibrio sp.]|nr:DUF4875 domain-containing protein [Desulfovibrio sp.]
MKEALPYLFLLGAVVAFIAAVVCLFTPRAAIFFRNRTRLKGVAVWMAICLACVVLMIETIPEKYSEAAKAKRAAAAQAETEAEKVRAEAAEKARALAEAQKPRLVPYREEELDDTSHALRKRGSARIMLADPAADFRQQDLVATCMAAARFYVKKYGLQEVSVFFWDMPGDKPWQGTQLARCFHAPDGGPKGGGSQWGDVAAVTRPLTEQERQMKELWGSWRGEKWVKKEADLEKAIGEKLGIPPEKVMLTPVWPEPVDFRPFKDVKPQGPEK